jgi:hypothetical protein
MTSISCTRGFSVVVVCVAVACLFASKADAVGGYWKPAMEGEKYTAKFTDEAKNVIIGEFAATVLWNYEENGSVTVTEWDAKAKFEFEDADGKRHSIVNEEVKKRIRTLSPDFSGTLMGDIRGLMRRPPSASTPKGAKQLAAASREPRPGLKPRLVLARIIADRGDGSHLRVTLRMGDTIKQHYVPTSQSRKSGVLAFSFGSGEVTATASRERIIASGGSGITRLQTEFGNPRVKVIGEFFLDSTLNSAEGIVGWDGKREGAIHTLQGKLTICGYEFDSDPLRPLTFKMTRKGYVYLQGVGTAKDLKKAMVAKLP